MYDDTAPDPNPHHSDNQNNAGESKKLNDISDEITQVIESKYQDKPDSSDEHISVETVSESNLEESEDKEEKLSEKRDKGQFLVGIIVFAVISVAASLSFIYFITQQGATIPELSNVQVSQTPR